MPLLDNLVKKLSLNLKETFGQIYLLAMNLIKLTIIFTYKKDHWRKGVGWGCKLVICSYNDMYCNSGIYYKLGFQKVVLDQIFTSNFLCISSFQVSQKREILTNVSLLINNSYVVFMIYYKFYHYFTVK